jgi:hypothetical protein
MGYQRMVFDSRLSGWPEMKINFLLTRKAQRAFWSATVILLVVADRILPAYILEKVSIKAKGRGGCCGTKALKPQSGSSACAI